MPNLCALARRGASTFSARTVFPSITLPAHASMLRGIDPSVHGIVDNTPTTLSATWPTFLQQAKNNGRSTAALLNWAPIDGLVEENAADTRYFLDGGYGGDDDRVIAAAASSVLATRPEVAFAYLVSPDLAGHDHGWGSPEYYQALATSDLALGEIVAAAGNDCAILVTTDHGGHGNDHTTSAPIDMITFMTLRADGVEPLTTVGEASILDVAPTVATLAGFEPSPTWSGTSLVGRQVSHVDHLLSMVESMSAHAYGERVNMLDHSLLAANKAQRAGASREQVVACLLHDIGHLLGDAGEWGLADHANTGAEFLQQLLPPGVVEPIRLHVDAKRFLVATDPTYRDALSKASQQSLLEQGGPFTSEECHAFSASAWAAEAVALRRFDDAGKGTETPPRLEEFRPFVEAVLHGADL